MVENAQLLHVEQLRQFAVAWAEQVVQDCIELLYRCGTAKKSTFSELPFRKAQGGVGEGRLTMRDIERAGIDVRVDYHEDDLEAELKKNNIFLPRLQAGVLSRQKTRDYLGVAEPDAEEEQIDAEFALTHPSMQMARAPYPVEYSNSDSPGGDSIVASHTLIPEALYHIFAGYGEMLSPNLPLRRDQHEMIATIVSVENRCFY